MECKICKSSSVVLVFKKRVLGKYDVSYFRCNECEFIFTEQPYWLKEAYSNAITSLDIGLLGRNIYLFQIVKSMIIFFFNSKAKFLDYAGGYGVFTRLMRDAGFNYYREDVYCENLFAKGFDITDVAETRNYELITAFELFEHLENPINDLEKPLLLSDNLLFSTELIPKNKSGLETWWYFTPETGQHISFYSVKSLNELAKRLNMHFYTNGVNIHLFTKKKINNRLFKILSKQRISRLLGLFLRKKSSLLQADFNKIKFKINQMS